jgi:hypothetical protein
VEAVIGSYSNVVGLPLAETWGLLEAFGVIAGAGRAPDAGDRGGGPPPDAAP